jgi:predicted Mrr-cat superfamily restriction endonuclease
MAILESDGMNMGQALLTKHFFSAGGKNVLNAFISRMQIGDIVLSCFTERTIDAIGRSEGEYECNRNLMIIAVCEKLNGL